MNKLPLESIRLLSSSQVITSPSSVVKELIENAFDAGARSLDVKLEKFCLEKIEVRDDGCGIKESDTEFMAQRYYTSKILKHEDLQMLETYGFRGEALGSLCQVADVCVVTRTTADPVAVLYRLDHNGKICSTKPTHDGVGTTVITTNLFKNFPVRKQCFQTTKKCKEELKKIEDILMAYGLINPEVRIILRNNKNIIWQKNKSSDIRTALTDVFGIQVVNQFEYFEYCDSNLHFSVRCFVPKNDSDPRLMWRSSNDRTFIFVNKRYVIWKELSQILKKQCVLKNKEVNSGKYPICFVSLCLSSQDVDVNLEANKTKVIITHKDDVLEIITKELDKIYNVNDVTCSTEKTHLTQEKTEIQSSVTVAMAPASTDEEAHLDDSCELREQELSGAVSNKKSSTTSSENEQLRGMERSEISSSGVEVLVNNDRCIAENKSFHQEGNSDMLESSNTNNSGEVTNNCTSLEEHDLVGTGVLPEKGDLMTREDSFAENNPASDSDCTEGSKDNDNNNSIDTTLEKQDDLKSKSDLDELLENFINDSDIIDDSLLDVSLEAVLPNQEQWSKGQGLVDKSGRELEPVKLLQPSNKQNEKSNRTPLSNGKRKHISDKDDSSSSKSDSLRPSKKNKKHSMISGQSLLTSVLQSPKTTCNTTTRGKTKDVSFSLTQLKQLASHDRPKTATTKEDFQLIKRLDPWGVWLVHKKRELFILNPYRIQELLLYKRLLSTYVVPREKLDKAIILDERILCGIARYTLLEELVMKNKQNVTVWCCKDERLVSNGFEIKGRFDGENGKMTISLVKMNATIPYFGISDLVEVIDLIKDNESCPENGNQSQGLTSCRTKKVCVFLKDEAARISRSLPSRLSDVDITELLKNMNEYLNEGENTCIHNRPLLHSLVSF